MQAQNNDGDGPVGSDGNVEENMTVDAASATGHIKKEAAQDGQDKGG